MKKSEYAMHIMHICIAPRTATAWPLGRKSAAALPYTYGSRQAAERSYSPYCRHNAAINVAIMSPYVCRHNCRDVHSCGCTIATAIPHRSYVLRHTPMGGTPISPFYRPPSSHVGANTQNHAVLDQFMSQLLVLPHRQRVGSRARRGTILGGSGSTKSIKKRPNHTHCFLIAFRLHL